MKLVFNKHKKVGEPLFREKLLFCSKCGKWVIIWWQALERGLKLLFWIFKVSSYCAQNEVNESFLGPKSIFFSFLYICSLNFFVNFYVITWIKKWVKVTFFRCLGKIHCMLKWGKYFFGQKSNFLSFTLNQYNSICWSYIWWHALKVGKGDMDC